MFSRAAQAWENELIEVYGVLCYILINYVLLHTNCCLKASVNIAGKKSCLELSPFEVTVFLSTFQPFHTVTLLEKRQIVGFWPTMTTIVGCKENVTII